MTGILDWLGLNSSTNPNASAGTQPVQPPQNKLGLFGATLSDVGASLNGQRPTNLDAYRQTQMAVAQKQARDAALQAYQAAQTPADKQAALLQFWGAGGDTAGLGAVLNSQKPTLRDIGPNGVASIDSNGVPTVVIPGAPKPAQRPLISGGMQSLDNGATWQQIPGYAAQQAAIATGKREPKVAAPGSINIPHPGSMY